MLRIVRDEKNVVHLQLISTEGVFELTPLAEDLMRADGLYDLDWVRAHADGEWNEEDHPRDPNGEFGLGGQEPTAPGRDTVNPKYDPQAKKDTADLDGKLHSRDFDKLPTTEVALDDLKSPQRDVEQRKVDLLVEHWDQGRVNSEPIYVVQTAKGDRVIWEGNHRVLAAQQLGHKTIPAKVLKVE